MEGGHDPDCRRTMPWKQIEQGAFAEQQRITKALIALRKENSVLRSGAVIWYHKDDAPRLVCYDRVAETAGLRIYLNSTDRDIPISADPVFAHKYENGILKVNGILICRISP